jgi:sialic acid synthase SpsE
LFLASPFGPESADALKSLDPAAVKIASPELSYVQLLRTVSAWGLPALLSSGVSSLADMEAALALFDRSKVCLLHCVTSYPAPETDYNLNLIKNLAALFGVSAGVSDHSLDPCLVPLLALACGASVIEKHFCISRKDSGLDDPIALPAPDFARMVTAVRRAQGMRAEAVIQEASDEYSAEKVNLVLGDGVKRLAVSEAENYGRTNRSIHALREIQAGEILSAENCAVLRTEKLLRPGLPPCMLEKITGRAARQFIPAGEGIRFEDV